MKKIILFSFFIFIQLVFVFSQEITPFIVNPGESTIPYQFVQMSYINPVDVSSYQLDKTKAVGTTQGSWDITSTGAMIYTIPLFSSPGTAGVQPNLSLKYNSQGGNGILGFGWDIEGLSAIKAVPKIFYNDGAGTQPQMDRNDVYALDGVRMLKYSTEGGESKYMLEIGSQMSISSFSSVSSGQPIGRPSMFKTWDVNGWEYEYGKNTDSQIKAIGAVTPYMWRLNQATDPNGNYIKYTYLTYNGESVITKISYTGNDGAEIAPYNTIEFEYHVRKDKSTEYIGGYEIKHELLLKNILIKNENVLVKKYVLDYAFDKVSHLTKITECAGDGSQLNPIIIEWGNSEVSSNVWKTISGVPNRGGMLTGDLNGDGISDMYAIEDGYRYTYTSVAKDRYVESVIEPWYNISPQGGFIGDFNNRGCDDVLPYAFRQPVGALPHSYEIWSWNYLGSSFSVYGNADMKLKIEAAEPMGDGKKYTFLFRYQNDTLNWSCYYRSGMYTMNFSNQLVGSGKFVGAGIYKLVDYDGDGCDELAVRYKDDGRMVFYKLGNGKMNEVYSLSDLCKATDCKSKNTSVQYLFGDLNGDGKQDLVVVDKSFKMITPNEFKFTNHMHSYIFNGKEYVHRGEIIVDDEGMKGAFYLADLDGDGKVEFISAGDKTIIYKYHDLANTLSLITTKNGVFSGFGDFNGDGISDMLFGNEVFYMENNGKRHLVHSVTDGFNQRTRFEYKTITDGSVYKKGEGAVFPLRDFQKGIYVVSAVESPNIIGGFNRDEYLYADAKVHLQGKGILGFMEITQLNLAINRKIKETYEQSGRHYYLVPKKRESFDLKTGVLKSSLTYTNEFGGVQLSANLFNLDHYVTKSIMIDEINNKKIESKYIYDRSSGKVAESEVCYYTPKNNTQPFFKKQEKEKGYTTRYRNLRTPDSKEVVFVQDGLSESSEVFWTYDALGNILTVLNHKNDSKMELNITAKYTKTGLPQEIIQKNKQSEQRVETYEYDTKHRKITKVTKTGDFVTQYTHDNKFGNLLSEKGINGLTTQYQYNAWGALIRIIRPDGNGQNITTSWFSSTSPLLKNALYKITNESSTEKKVEVYYGSKGEELMTAVGSDFGNTLYSYKKYDALGRISFESFPQNRQDLSGKFNYISYTYDPSTHKIIREKEYVQKENGAVVEGKTKDISYQYDFSNNTITITDNITKVNKVEKYNILGELIEVTEPKGKLKYYYSPKRNISRIETIMGAIQYRYDVAGNRIYEKDPNAGETTYQYDGFNQLVKKIDAKKTQTDYTYSLSGQLLSKVISSADGEKETYTYVYSTSGVSKGLLSKVTNSSSTTNYEYNQYGITRILEQIDGRIFAKDYVYNKYGKIAEEIYPSGGGSSGRFGIRYIYSDPKGGVTQINNYANQALWRKTAVNTYGQIAGAVSGNGFQTAYIYDDISPLLKRVRTALGGNYVSDWDLSYENGLIKSKTDLLTSQKEIYEYDSALRLKKVTPVIKNQTKQSTSYTYNSKGNMTYKSDLGILDYGVSGKPNALSNVDLMASVSENPEEGYNTNKCIVTYTPFHKVKSIVNEKGDSLVFTYGTNQQRIKTVMKSPGKPLVTKYYMGNYELETSVISRRQTHYIYKDCWVGAYVKDITFQSANQDSMYYIFTDHLGSFERITNQQGQLVQMQSFDVWGNRRSTVNWLEKDNMKNHIFTRGFTGHEHLDEFQLINMNGRMYDPVVGQFLSPDPLAEEYLNISPYSYCAYNPVNYTDPSGYKIISLFSPTFWISASPFGFWSSDIMTQGWMLNCISRYYFGRMRWIETIHIYDSPIMPSLEASPSSGGGGGGGGIPASSKPPRNDENPNDKPNQTDNNTDNASNALTVADLAVDQAVDKAQRHLAKKNDPTSKLLRQNLGKLLTVTTGISLGIDAAATQANYNAYLSGSITFEMFVYELTKTALPYLPVPGMGIMGTTTINYVDRLFLYSVELRWRLEYHIHNLISPIKR